MTETQIRDIERHFDPAVPDDKITTRPDLWWLSLHFTLSAFSVLWPASFHGGIRQKHHWEIHKGESSLIPGSSLSTALISRRLWLVGLCLICFTPLPLCRKGCLPVPQFGCEVHQTHRQTHKSSKETHKDVLGGRFFPAFWRHRRWPQRHRIIHQHTAAHANTHTEKLQCSRAWSTSVERVQLLIFY